MSSFPLLGGNPKNRPWKRTECQWSAKRKLHKSNLFPECEFRPSERSMGPIAFLKSARINSVNDDEQMQYFSQNLSIQQGTSHIRRVGNIIVKVQE